MSKLVDLIVASATDRRKPIFNTVRVNAKFEVDSLPPSFMPSYPVAIVYHIGVKIGGEIAIDDRDDGKLIKMAVETIQRQVVEEIYGEFRMPLLEIERALWDHDHDKARALLADLRKQMFLPSSFE